MRDEEIQAVVFEQIAGRMQVIGVGKENLSTSVEMLSDNDLLDAADKAISTAEESLPEGIQTHRTIFGVKESWVEDSHISQSYLDKLKQLSKALDLQPIGFLVFPEAIAHLLQKEEGAPVSGILVDSGREKVTITLLRAGRIIQTREVNLGTSLTETVEKALHTFTDVEILPSRIVLFDNGDKTTEASFLKHHWSKSLPFLHVPQIVTLSRDFDTRAILFGTATQMGFDAVDLVKAAPVQKTAHVFDDVPEGQGITEVAGLKNSQSLNEEDNESLEDNDEQDLSQKKNETGQEDGEAEYKNGEPMQEENSDYFGFVKDTDIAQNAPHADELHSAPLSGHAMDEVMEEVPEEVKEEETTLPFGFSLSGPAIVEGAKNTFSRLMQALPKKFSFSSFFAQKRRLSTSSGGILDYFTQMNKLLIIIPLAILLIIGFFVWTIFGVKAKVTLVLSPKVITQTQNVTFATDQPTDPAGDTIGASAVSVDETGKVTVNATGTKDVGDAAKGTVTIFNSDTASHTLSSGTTITSSNGLTFTLDQSVNVASASSDPFTGTTPATTTAPVTATTIGTDYNLPSQTHFAIDGTSVMAAKNDNAFSGGSKKTVTVVSSTDVTSATTQLTQNLSGQAKADLANKADADKVILPDFTDTTLSNKSLDNQVGDQATSLTLTATVTFSSVMYKKSDLDSYAKSVMESQIPSNLVLAPQGVTFATKNLAVTSGNAKATLDMKASLIPSIDTKSLTQQISGKSFTQARAILSGVPQFSDAAFALSPNLFFLPQTLPRLSSHITISLVTND